MSRFEETKIPKEQFYAALKLKMKIKIKKEVGVFLYR